MIYNRGIMKRVAASLLILVFLLLAAIPSFASVTIHIVPGPLDGCRILTPWGDFVAIQNGSRIWIGTDKEYEHLLVKSISEADGFKEVKLEGDKANTYSFVSRDYPSVDVGSLQLHSISINILFGVKSDKKLHRPYKPTNAEYVSVAWVQSEGASTLAQIYDVVDKKTYRACNNTVDHGVHFTEFVVPRKALMHKTGLVFTARKQKPGYLSMGSIVNSHYNSIIVKNKDLSKSRISISDDDLQDLKQLNLLDSSIPTTL